MSMPHIRPYGSWPSSITSEMIISDYVKLGFVDIDKDFFYYDETRPKEKGKTALIRKKKGEKKRRNRNIARKF